MANPEHVEIVKQGAKVLNRWREQNPKVKLDLSNAKLNGLDLNEANLQYANLSKAKLGKAKLNETDFRNADMRGAFLKSAQLDRSNLRLVDLRKSDLRKALLREANLSFANLHGANMRYSKLNSAELGKAILNFVDLSKAYLNKANLNGAILTSSDLSRAVLFATNLRDANLIKTNFTEAYLSKADFSNASASGTYWSNIDLSKTVGLSSIKHLGPSSLGVDTLMKSQGKIPEVFLRGCGLSDEFVSYIPGHFSRTAIEFYSCFISYSHEDKFFARRLHDALQGRGIRCWLDEHQILPGDNIYERIDHGIRVWDKVLLCASRHSLTSGWVDDELKHAFAKEKQLFKDRGCEVLSLIPLNLDGHLFSDWNHSKKNQVLERMAPDFTGWETDNAKFEQQLERVVKALQTDNTGREPEPKPKL